ncbi:MAG TPA: LecA/PA-IL family lectin [Terriglobia bacterium]|nr:LecA/PA-IL family lectin [Terriglobia bacterium]
MRNVDLGDLGFDEKEQELLRRETGVAHRDESTPPLSWAFAIACALFLAIWVSIGHPNDPATPRAPAASGAVQSTPPTGQQPDPADAIARSNPGIEYRERKQYDQTAAEIPNLGGAWKGTVSAWEAELFLVQNAQTLRGVIVYAGVEEHVSGILQGNGTVVLRGTRYRRVSGLGDFQLDTFFGRWSSDLTTMAGQYRDNRSTGAWTMSRAFAGMPAAETSASENPQPTEGRITRELNIDSVNPWTNTGIPVRKGDVVTIKATGVIHPCIRNNCRDGRYNQWIDAGGFVDLPYLFGFPSMALTAWIGNSALFVAGKSATLISTADGNLFLGINDIPMSFSDNAGRFEVRIIVQSRTNP